MTNTCGHCAKCCDGRCSVTGEANYETKKKRIRGVIMDALNRYKTGDGGADTWGPWAGKDVGETFSVHESDFEKVVDMIVSQIWGL